MPTLTATGGGVQIQDGSYPATALRAEEQPPAPGMLGAEPWLKWAFRIRDGSPGGVELTTGSSLKFGPQSKARKWAEALLNRKIIDGEKITLEQVLPRDCIAIIRHNDKGFAYVDGLLPAASLARKPEPSDIPF